ncbi:unnamed protein product, partial [marine sediment metagenome]
ATVAGKVSRKLNKPKYEAAKKAAKDTAEAAARKAERARRAAARPASPPPKTRINLKTDKVGKRVPGREVPSVNKKYTQSDAQRARRSRTNDTQKARTYGTTDNVRKIRETDRMLKQYHTRRNIELKGKKPASGSSEKSRVKRRLTRKKDY